RPGAIASLFQSKNKVSYFYTKKDYADKKKVFDKLKECDWINAQQVKAIQEVDPKVPILLPNGTMDPGNGIDIVSPTKLAELLDILAEERKVSRGIILFQFGVDGLDQFVHPAIKAIASHMMSIRIASPGFGLNHSHPYCQAVFLRPFTNSMLSRLPENDLIKELRPWQGKCIVLGNELSPTVIKVMGALNIERLPTKVAQEGTEVSIYSKLHGHNLIARYFSYLQKDIISRLLAEEDEDKLRKNVADILFTSRAIVPNPEPVLRLDDLSTYEYGVMPTVNPFPLHTTTAGLFQSWSDAVYDPSASITPVLLIVQGPKGGMKSTLTKRLVDYFTSQVPVGSDIRYGRVDSDAWGKWVANPRIFSTWVEFDSFQNNEVLKSQVEIDIEHILQVHNITDINTRELDLLSEVQSDFSMYLQTILTNENNGLEKLVAMLLQLPDLPRAIFWEVHTHAEIGLLPPTHYICNVMPCWNTAYAVTSRPRPTSSPLAQFALHGLYKSLSPFMIYMNIHLGECARAIGFCPGR
ncbi:nonstructural protein NSP8, partial [Grapevine Cabernet Sauvignon reovirus]|uniref:nonstructural protein NSP8 n=1 Tax=Grapevine Cabernet Sauvignon reovirus TaxID=1640277 RepID=UPI0006BC6DEE